MACPASVRRVCVIGAGVSGLTAIKHLVEYGIEVVCYEKGEYIGGLWRYNEGNREGFGSVMRNTILNTSKEFVTFSDFPMQSEHPNFMPNNLIYDYILAYCRNFSLDNYIVFETEVLKVERSSDYALSGKWEVTTRRRSSEIETSTFSAVVVANGHHVKPFIPEISGIKSFAGTVMHSHDYKDHNQYLNRCVLVVGLGNSGGDVACELARISKQVYCSTRSGTWVTRRVVRAGYPRDIFIRTRFYERMQKILPKCVQTKLALSDYTSFLDHDLYGLRPRENPGQSPVLLADDLPFHLSCGKIRIRSKISHFTEHEVHYEDGTKDKVDDVIFCTGYDFDFQLIEDGLIPVVENQVELWKRIFSPILKWNSLVIIGLVDPMGPTITTCEMQSRTIAHIWANAVDLPNNELMKKEILEEKQATSTRFLCSARKASLQIDFIRYMDQLANIVGCMPPLQMRLFLSDPKLAFMLNFGPVSASHYRLCGPHKWYHARKQILGSFDRVHLAMNPHRKSPRGIPIVDLVFNVQTIIVLLFSILIALVLLTFLVNCSFTTPTFYSYL